MKWARMHTNGGEVEVRAKPGRTEREGRRTERERESEREREGRSRAGAGQLSSSSRTRSALGARRSALAARAGPAAELDYRLLVDENAIYYRVLLLGAPLSCLHQISLLHHLLIFCSSLRLSPFFPLARTQRVDAHAARPAACSLMGSFALSTCSPCPDTPRPARPGDRQYSV